MACAYQVFKRGSTKLTGTKKCYFAFHPALDFAKRSLGKLKVFEDHFFDIFSRQSVCLSLSNGTA